MDKTTRNPSDHELNAVLARVVGVEIWKDEWNYVWLYEAMMQFGTQTKAWNPLHDANQMELVEEAIRNQHKRLSMTTHWGGSHYHVTIRPYGKGEYEGLDRDKKRAFALAVHAMEQERHKESHAR